MVTGAVCWGAIQATFSETICSHRTLCRNTSVQLYVRHHCRCDTMIPIDMLANRCPTNFRAQILFRLFSLCSPCSNLFKMQGKNCQ